MEDREVCAEVVKRWCKCELDCPARENEAESGYEQRVLGGAWLAPVSCTRGNTSKQLMEECLAGRADNQGCLCRRREVGEEVVEEFGRKKWVEHERQRRGRQRDG